MTFEEEFRAEIVKFHSALFAQLALAAALSVKQQSLVPMQELKENLHAVIDREHDGIMLALTAMGMGEDHATH